MRLIDAEPIEKYIENGLNCKDPKKGFGHDAIDILTEIHCAPTICQPPNAPLTLDELRKMDGEPVWVVFTPDTDGERLSIWALVSVAGENNEIFLQNSLGGRSAYKDVAADIEAIYRRKPEKGQ